MLNIKKIKLPKTKAGKVAFLVTAMILIAGLAVLDPLNRQSVSASIFLTSGTTWTVPSNWNNSNNTIHVIGGGGGGVTGNVGNSGASATGGGGGGGGAFASVSNVTLTPGSTVTVAIGAGGSAGNAGGDTYFCNSTANCANINGSAVVVGAKGGSGASGTSGGAGGLASSSIGTTTRNGGTGGTAGGSNGNGGSGGGGGAGAAGVNAVGNNGSAGLSGSGNSGGGGGAGGQGNGTFGGAGGSAGLGNNGNGGTGGDGSEFDGTHGSGGGSGGGGGGDRNGAGGGDGGTAGLYGAGGGGGGGGGRGSGVSASAGIGAAGRPGLIVITYRSIDQNRYRWRDNGGTALAAENTAGTVTPYTTARVRFGVTNSAAVSVNNNYRLEYSTYSGSSCSSDWTVVPAGSGSGVGPNNPSSAANNTSVGSVSWASTGNVFSADNTYSDVTLTTSDRTSHYLTATNFGFNIPTNETIVGIQASVERNSGSGADTSDSSVRIIKGGVISGDEKAGTSGELWSALDTYANYGGVNDTWGLSWTPADVNSSNFGLAFSVFQDGNFSFNVSVDHIRITVYTASSGAGAPHFNMVDTTAYTDQSATSNDSFLSDPAGLTFTSGKNVESPSNTASNVTIGQSQFTELEYAIQANSDAVESAYCFRLTNSGTALESYTQYALLNITYPPEPPIIYSVLSGSTNVSKLPFFQLRSRDINNDYVQYSIELCPTNSWPCASGGRTYNQTSSQTCWTGQNANSSTAYNANRTLANSTYAICTVPTADVLNQNTLYYFRARSIDPGGSNTWSPYVTGSFTTGSLEVLIQGGTTINGGTYLGNP